jgi:hypothetical protein
MAKAVLITIGLICSGWMTPLSGQTDLAFNMGGGISTPLNPTGAYTGVSGNFNVGAGYSLGKRNSITGEFLWSGLPPDVTNIHPIKAPTGNINLYSLTVNYRRHIDSIYASPLGIYAIAGGGWYYRYSTIDKSYTVPPGTVCQPIYNWWGYGCDPNGYTYTDTIAARGSSSGGVNGGVGFTLRLGDTNWKFYTEARYHYAFSARIPSTVIPITFGIRYD